MKNYLIILFKTLFLIPIFVFGKDSTIQSDSLIFDCNELLGRPTSNSITIHANANKALNVYYEYGTDSLNFVSKTQELTSIAGTPYVVVLENLEPDTKYFYRMKYRESGTSNYLSKNIHTFNTQRKAGTTFTFAIEADPHLDSNSIFESYALTLNNILSKQPDFLIDLGDTFFCEKLANKSQSEVTKRHLLLRSYFDIACHSVPLFLVIGNHEGESGWELDGTANNLAVMASNTRNFYFPNPLPNSFYTGDNKPENFVGQRENYYAFEWGNTLIVVLDPFWYTVTKPGWGWTLGAEQYNWFKNTLTTSKAKFKFVFCHNLVGGTDKDARGGVEVADFYEWGGRDTNMTYSFDKNRPGWRKPIHQLMVENGVNIFFHGHDHFYGKQEKDGIIYQECPQPSNRNITNTQAKNYGYVNGIILAGRGYLLVTVSDTNAKIDYIKTYLANEEKGGAKNGDIGDTYTIYPKVTSVSENNDIISKNMLDQNFPNPYDDETYINYRIQTPDNVQLKVYDIFGREIKTLVNQYQKAGSYTSTLNSQESGLPAGVYYYQLSTSNFTETKTMVILK